MQTSPSKERQKKRGKPDTCHFMYGNKNKCRVRVCVYEAKTRGKLTFKDTVFAYDICMAFK